MNKKELINFINSIDFELCTDMSFTYFKKKPSQYSHDYENEPKTITFNKDFKQAIDEIERWNSRRFDDVFAGLREIREKVEKDD